MRWYARGFVEKGALAAVDLGDTRAPIVRERSKRYRTPGRGWTGGVTAVSLCTLAISRGSSSASTEERLSSSYQSMAPARRSMMDIWSDV